MTADEIKREYELRLPRLDQLRTEILFSLERELKISQVKLHSTSSRIKTLQSCLEKVTRKNLINPYDELRDLVGVRIVCLFLTDIPLIGDIIRSTFDVISEDNKITGDDVSNFGYMSVHFDVTMKRGYVGPRYDAIVGLACEIQVRTIAMDAWANVAHHLSYKTDIDVPDALKKDFHALSGLFYVADKHFELFYGASILSRNEAAKALDTTNIADVDRQSLNADTLAAYLAKRYSARARSSATDVSELLTELVGGGVMTVGDLNRLLTATERAFAKYESASPPSDATRFSEVGVARISAQIYAKEFHRLGYARSFPGHTEVEFEQSDQKYAKYRKLVQRPSEGELS